MFTNNYIESWHRVLKELGLKNKKNHRLDLLVDTCVISMHMILHRALYAINDDKLRKKMGKLWGLAESHVKTAVLTDSPFHNRSGEDIIWLSGDFMMSRRML